MIGPDDGADDGQGVERKIPRADWSNARFEDMVAHAGWPADFSRADRIAAITAAWDAHMAGQRRALAMDEAARRERFARDICKARGLDPDEVVPDTQSPLWMAYGLHAAGAMNAADREAGRGPIGEAAREDAEARELAQLAAMLGQSAAAVGFKFDPDVDIIEQLLDAVVRLVKGARRRVREDRG